MVKIADPFLIPINEQGLLDYKSVFSFIHGTLKQPIGVLDDLTVQEVSWLLDTEETNQKDFYEMVSYSVKIAMVSVMNGKDMKMFEDATDKEEKKITPEERQQELEEIKNIFN